MANVMEIIEVDKTMVACDAGGGPLDHPRVFYLWAKTIASHAPIVPVSLSCASKHQITPPSQLAVESMSAALMWGTPKGVRDDG